ncbi:MAG: DUF3291 domain-containing protein [Pseudomonadota bacterium]
MDRETDDSQVADANTFVLAHCNVARAKGSYEDPIMQGFVDRLDPLHELADNHPGFIWRYDPPDDDDTVLRVFGDDRVLFNLSLWESVETLGTYVYRTVHKEAIRKRDEWFVPFGGPSMVLWWVAADHQPPVAEAKDRLDRLGRDGPTEHAFTFKHRFARPS